MKLLQKVRHHVFKRSVYGVVVQKQLNNKSLYRGIFKSSASRQGRI